MANPDVQSTFLGDLYLSPQAYEPGQPTTPENFTVDITHKPLISLVWGGFYLMMAGGIVAMVRRAMDARQAAIA
jgi:cytochrome c biogenesis factor